MVLPVWQKEVGVADLLSTSCNVAHVASHRVRTRTFGSGINAACENFFSSLFFFAQLLDVSLLAHPLLAESLLSKALPLALTAHSSMLQYSKRSCELRPGFQFH